MVWLCDFWGLFQSKPLCDKELLCHQLNEKRKTSNIQIVWFKIWGTFVEWGYVEVEFGCNHCRQTCSSLLCPLVQAAPALSVCAVFGLLSVGSWGCWGLPAALHGHLGAFWGRTCRAWHRAEMEILVFILPSRGNLKIAAAVQSKDITVGEKHISETVFSASLTSTDQFSLLVESWWNAQNVGTDMCSNPQKVILPICGCVEGFF